MKNQLNIPNNATLFENQLNIQPGDIIYLNIYKDWMSL